jgi:hypothetical protein
LHQIRATMCKSAPPAANALYTSHTLTIFEAH